MRSVARRCHALLLTLIFLGGGTSLPSLDVLFFHLHGEASRSSVHIEPANGCSSHVGHCSIGCPATASGALAAVTFTPQFGDGGPFRAPVPPVPAPTPAPLCVGFQSRAPPSLG
jgi:hypothetical protein